MKRYTVGPHGHEEATKGPWVDADEAEAVERERDELALQRDEAIRECGRLAMQLGEAHKENSALRASVAAAKAHLDGLVGRLDALTERMRRAG